MEIFSVAQTFFLMRLKTFIVKGLVESQVEVLTLTYLSLIGVNKRKRDAFPVSGIQGHTMLQIIKS